jgi:hypothetical protein
MVSVRSHVKPIALATFVAMLCSLQAAQGANLNVGAGLDEGFLFFNNQNGIFTPIPKGVAGTVGPNPLGGIESLVSDVFQTNVIPLTPGEPPSLSASTYHFAGQGEAFANFGQIGAGSFFDVSSATAALFFQDLGPARTFRTGGAEASASFGDTLTITSQGGANVRLVFTINGSLVFCVPEPAENCNPDLVDPTMSFGVLANGTPVGNVIVDRNGSHGPFFDPLTGRLTTSPIPISGPIDLAVAIEANIGLAGLSQLSNPFFTTGGTVDFAETAILTGIEVFDASGNPVSDFTVSSQSGTRYPLSSPVSGVPEAGTAALLSCGVASIAALRQTQKARSPLRHLYRLRAEMCSEMTGSRTI